MTTALDVYRCPLQGIRFVEASAGTGKTWALTGLYVRLVVENDLTVDQILVVSFTQAATAELRERIRSRLAELLAALEHSGVPSGDPFVATLLDRLREDLSLADETIRLRLERALNGFDDASIHTIHGFCKRVLDDAPFVTGMPLALEQLTNDDDLRREVVLDFWRRWVADGALSPALSAALGKNPIDRFVQELGRRLDKPLATVIWPTDIDVVDTQSPGSDQALLDEVRALWNADRSLLIQQVENARVAGYINGSVYRETTVATATASWDRLLASRTLDDVPDTLEKLENLTFKKFVYTAKAKKAPPRPTNAFYQRGSDLLDRLEARRIHAVNGRLRLVRELLTLGPAHLKALKQERRVVSYADLLAEVYERLKDPARHAFAGDLRRRYPAALVDEFQDTDPLQWGIFETIYGTQAAAEANTLLFLVGDPKQAIYQFRNADLNVYLTAKDTAIAQAAARGAPEPVATLADNQRSSEPLLKGLNAFFGAHPHAFLLEGLTYPELQFGRKPRPTFTAVDDAKPALRIWQLPGPDTDTLLLAEAARAAATQATAAEIARLLTEAAAGRIAIGDRPLSAGDIAVIVPAHVRAREIRAALTALGIGSVERSQRSVYQSAEADDLARVLTAILEPTRLSTLRAALATELLGHDATRLLELAADGPQTAALVERFSRYRARWQEAGVGVMLRELLGRETVGERLLGLRHGERRLTNVLQLIECLHTAAEQHATPDALMQWFASRRLEPKGDEEAQLRLESDRNLVQIVTIHASKGLEYPVVFCPYLFDPFNPERADGAWGCEYADGAQRRIDYTEGISKDNHVKALKDRERTAERLRLIYVALTRAVHRVYLVAGPYLQRTSFGVSSKQCRAAPLTWCVQSPTEATADWFETADDRTPADVTHAWTRWVAASAPNVSIEPLPTTPGVALARPLADPTTLAALPLPGPLPPPWRIGSFTGLVHGRRHDRAAADSDLRTEALEDRGDPTSVDAEDILHFPRGTRAGDCIHAVFEAIDFTDASGWPSAIDAALKARPQGALPNDLKARLPRMLEGMVRSVLSTDLGGGLSLRDVPRLKRLTEWEFWLPSRRLAPAPLTDLLALHGYRIPRLEGDVLRGYLHGFVDLIVEHAGQFFVIDWKSNHLGFAPEHYAPQSLEPAMQTNGYHLQHILYTVALHRHLKRRIIHYDYDHHMGGVRYLFVRGVRPDWQVEGRACGVYASKPPRALIETLSQRFDETEGVA